MALTVVLGSLWLLVVLGAPWLAGPVREIANDAHLRYGFWTPPTDPEPEQPDP